MFPKLNEGRMRSPKDELNTFTQWALSEASALSFPTFLMYSPYHIFF
jgi:hypothetical protein